VARSVADCTGVLQPHLMKPLEVCGKMLDLTSSIGAGLFARQAAQQGRALLNQLITLHLLN
jgi:hypothetical protein